MSIPRLPIVSALLLLSFATSLFADPVLGPPRELTPVRIDAAYGGRGYAAVETNGATSLVAWQDANAGRILFNILGADGQLLNEVPRELPGLRLQTGGRTVAVATDGTDFVVGWISSTSDTESQLHVASIRTNGEVSAIRQIAASAPVDVQIAWNGTKYLLVFQNGVSSGEVYGQFLERDSLPVGSQLKLGDAQANTPAVAAAGENFLVVFRSWTQVSAVAVSASGTMSGPYVVGSAQPHGSVWDDDVTSDGENFTVVWSDSVGGLLRQIRARSITAAGLLSPVVTLSEGQVDSTSPSIRRVPSGYVLAYLRFFTGTSGYSAELRISHLSPQLERISEQTLDSSRSFQMPDSAASASTAIVVWVSGEGEYPALGQQVYSSISRAGSSFSSPSVISRTAAQQESVVVAANASDSLTAWVERVGAEQRPTVRAQLLSRARTESIQLSTYAMQLSPAVAASPSDFLVVWVDLGASTMLRAVVIDRSGNPVGPPLLITDDVNPDTSVSALWGGDRYAIAFESSAGRIRLALVSSAGVVVVPVSPDRQYFTDRFPKLAFGGRQFLVTWSAAEQISCPFECPMGSDTRAARVSADGQLLDAAPLQVFETFFGASPAPVVWDGENFVIGHAGYPSLVARRIRPDGTFVDPLHGITLTRETGASFVLTHDGSAFTLAAARYNAGEWRKADILLKTFSHLEDAPATPFDIHQTAATSFDIASPAAGSIVLAESVRLEQSPYFGSSRVFGITGSSSPSAPLPPPAAAFAYALDGTVVIQWQDRSDDETGFVVEDSNGIEVAAVPANQSIAFISSATAGTHYYRVAAVRNGFRSEPSNLAEARQKVRRRGVRR